MIFFLGFLFILGICFAIWYAWSFQPERIMVARVLVSSQYPNVGSLHSISVCVPFGAIGRFDSIVCSLGMRCDRRAYYTRTLSFFGWSGYVNDAGIALRNFAVIDGVTDVYSFDRFERQFDSLYYQF